ncbi:centromere protein N isoform X2 [Sphaerodactylus townsendi]|uniref:centromere protein N isoform X2 n=1 Tax=Sphaerodactylus townsendi TaxID=933632 RepID=UPI0020264048|nr:centromere protein N isoform X2 [Sphaerodactylus townsendi]XP_048371493.1 centromere protein N isoform X2 [Sphaerodactylus townsendi]
MDEIVAEYIRRTVLRIPRSEIGEMLTTWGFLTESQLKSINLHQMKENLSQEVVQLCKENGATIKHAANLDIIYNYAHRDKKNWTVYKMTREEGDENVIFDWVDFKNKFKTSLRLLLRNVTITFKKYEDNSMWIRVAWGLQFNKPNQYKPTYVVYHSQTPYVFICHSIFRSCRTLLFQALLAATSYSDIQEMDLKSRCLDSLKDIVLKRCNQKVETFNPRPLQERNSILENVDPRIIQEDKKKKETIWKINEEDFGNGPLPKLQHAQYKVGDWMTQDRE